MHLAPNASPSNAQPPPSPVGLWPVEGLQQRSQPGRHRGDLPCMLPPHGPMGLPRRPGPRLPRGRVAVLLNQLYKWQHNLVLVHLVVVLQQGVVLVLFGRRLTVGVAAIGGRSRGWRRVQELQGCRRGSVRGRTGGSGTRPWPSWTSGAKRGGWVRTVTHGAVVDYSQEKGNGRRSMQVHTAMQRPCKGQVCSR